MDDNMSHVYSDGDLTGPDLEGRAPRRATRTDWFTPESERHRDDGYYPWRDPRTGRLTTVRALLRGAGV